MVIQQVRDTPAVRAEWQANQTARWGFNVSIHSPPSSVSPSANTSQALPGMWLVTDGASSFASERAFVGRDISQRAEAIANGILLGQSCGDADRTSCSTASASSRIPSFGNRVIVTPMADTGGGVISFALGTTILADDPTRMVLVFSTMNEFFDTMIASHPSDVVIQATDHLGAVRSQGGCAFSEALHSLSSVVEITTVATWTLSVGQCPSYIKKFDGEAKWLWVAGIVAATLLAIRLYIRALRKTWREHAQDEALAQQEVYSLIVGYICHEVRNPLHVLKSSFEVMSTVFTGSGGGGKSSNSLLSLSDDDKDGIVSDCNHAIGQMQVRITVAFLASLFQSDHHLIDYDVRLDYSRDRCACIPSTEHCQRRPGLSSNDERQVYADAQADLLGPRHLVITAAMPDVHG